MPRVDRADCLTVQANDARDALRTGRVVVVAAAEACDTQGQTSIFRVLLDGDSIGLVVTRDGAWIACRPGWVDTPRTRRRTAVRRLVMSHPRSILGL